MRFFLHLIFNKVWWSHCWYSNRTTASSKQITSQGCHNVRFRKLNWPNMLFTKGTSSPYGHERSDVFSPVQIISQQNVLTAAVGSSSVEEWVTLRRFSFTKRVTKKVSYFLIIISFRHIIYVTLTSCSFTFLLHVHVFKCNDYFYLTLSKLRSSKKTHSFWDRGYVGIQ